MEFMSLATLIKYGTPVLLFALVILQVVTLTLTTLLWQKVGRMEDKMVWRDTCEKEHKAVDQRLNRLEAAANGSLIR